MRRPMAGISRLEFFVVVLLFALLAGAFLQVIRHYQEQAERMAVDITVVRIKTGLLHQIADRLVRQTGRDGSDLVGSNPVAFLAQPPQGYMGEYKDMPADLLPGGSWYFDQKTRELAYKLNHASGFQARSGPPGRQEIRWRVGVRGEMPAGHTPVESLVLLQTVDYDWF